MSDNTAKTYKADKSAYSMTLRELMSLRARYYKMGVEEGKRRGIAGGYDFNNPCEMYRDCGLATVLPTGIPTDSSEITVPEVMTMALCSKLFNYRLSSVGEDYETHVYPEDLKILKIFTRWIACRDRINEMLRNPLTDGRKVSITYSMGPRGYSMPIRGNGVLEALTRRHVYTHDMSGVPYDVLVKSLNLEEEAKKSHGLLLPVGIQQEKSVFPFLVEKGVFWSEASDALRDVLSELYKNQGKSLHEMLKSYLASNDIINAIRAGIDTHINDFMAEHPEYELLGIHGTKAYLAGDAKESYAINIGSGAWGNKITQTNTPNTINDTVRYLKEYQDVREDVLGAPNRNFLPVSRVENGAGQGAGAEVAAQGDEWCWDARLLPVYVAEEDCVGAEYAYEDLCRGKYALASSPYSQKVKKDDLNVAPVTSDGNVPEGYMKAVQHSLLMGGAGSSKEDSAQGEGGVSDSGEPFPTGAPRVFQLKPRPIVMWNRLSKFSTVPDAERKMLSLPTDISRFTAEDVRNYLEFEGVPQSEFVVFNAVGMCDSQISRPMQAKYIGYNKDALFGFMGQYEELFTMEQATKIRGDLNDQYKKSAEAFESVVEYMLGLFPSNAIESEKEAKYRAVNEITGLMRIHTKETKSAYTRLMKTVQKAIKSTNDGNVVALGILEAPFNVDSVIAGDVASDMLYRFQEKLFARYVSLEKMYSNVRMWCARNPKSTLINEVKQLVFPQESKAKSGEPNSTSSIFNPATSPAEFGLTATPNTFPAPVSAGILMRLKSYLSGLNFEEPGDNDTKEVADIKAADIKAAADLKSVVYRSAPTVDEIVDDLNKVYSDAQDRYDASFDSIMYMVKSFGFASSFTGMGTGEFEELLAESEFVDFRGWCEKVSCEFQSFFDGCMHRLFTGDFVFKGGLENVRSVGAAYLTAMVDNYRQMMESVSEGLNRLVLAYSSSDVETIQSLSELPEEALKLGINVFGTEEQPEEPEYLTPDEEAGNVRIPQNEDIEKDTLSEWETTVSSPCDDGSLDSRMGKVEGFLSGVTTGIQGFSCVVEPSYNPYVGTPALVYNIGNSSTSTAYMRYANMVYGGDRASYKDWGVSAKVELLRNGVSKEDLLSRNPWERGSLEDTIYKAMVSYIYSGTGVIPVPVDVTEFQFDYAVSRVVESATGIPMAIVRGTSQKLSEYASKNRFKEF